MFSETRYALNGDLRVAYRTSREGPRDTVFIPMWFSNCEDFPEQPSLRGWVEAMTSLGRLIFFDQPGTGASDPVTSLPRGRGRPRASRGRVLRGRPDSSRSRSDILRAVAPTPGHRTHQQRGNTEADHYARPAGVHNRPHSQHALAWFRASPRARPVGTRGEYRTWC
jgi:hypothetical protein